MIISNFEILFNQIISFLVLIKTLQISNKNYNEKYIIQEKLFTILQVLEQEETFSEDTVSKSAILTDKIDVETQSESPGKLAAEVVDEKVNDYNTDTNNEEMDLVDEEAKSKLIAHYSKLLPWLYYVLAK